MTRFFRNMYFNFGQKMGWISLYTTQGTITFTAWNGRKRRYDNVKEFKFLAQ